MYGQVPNGDLGVSTFLTSPKPDISVFEIGAGNEFFKGGFYTLTGPQQTQPLNEGQPQRVGPTRTPDKGVI